VSIHSRRFSVLRIVIICHVGAVCGGGDEVGVTDKASASEHEMV
jgi:hypothetical protein